MLKDSCQLTARGLTLPGVLGPEPGVGKALYNTALLTHPGDRQGWCYSLRHPGARVDALTGHSSCPRVSGGRAESPGLCGTDFPEHGLGVVQGGNIAKNEPGGILQTQADLNQLWDSDREEGKHFPVSLPKLRGDPRFSGEGSLFNQLFLLSELKWK